VFGLNGAYSSNTNDIAINTLRNASIFIDNKIMYAEGEYSVKLNNFSDFE